MPGTAERGSCAGCGAILAADQRYCLECGRRRGEARIDYGLYLPGEGTATHEGSTAIEPEPEPESEPVAASRPAGQQGVGREVTPLMAACGLAALGAMLVVGVLIGRGGAPEPVAATPQVVQLGAMPATATGQANAAEQAADDADAAAVGGAEERGGGQAGDKAGKARGGAGANAKRKQGQGGGNAAAAAAPEASPEALEELEEATGEAFQEAQKKLPPEVATPGKAPPKDDKAPGGDSAGDAMVIE